MKVDCFSCRYSSRECCQHASQQRPHSHGGWAGSCSPMLFVSSLQPHLSAHA